jgi:hypothetical protein
MSSLVDSRKDQRRAKTVTRSFRINEAAFAVLEEEAKRRNVSTNTLLNQQLLQYANHDRFFKVGLVRISSVFFRRLLEAATDEELARVGEALAIDEPGAVMLEKSGEVTLNTTIEFLQMVSEYSGLYEYSQTKSPNGMVITIIHGLGRKGSVLYSAFAKAIFEAIGYSPKIRTHEHSIDFEILPNKLQEI